MYIKTSNIIYILQIIVRISYTRSRAKSPHPILPIVAPLCPPFLVFNYAVIQNLDFWNF